MPYNIFCRDLRAVKPAVRSVKRRSGDREFEGIGLLAAEPEPQDELPF